VTQVNALRGAQSLCRWFRETRRSRRFLMAREEIAEVLNLITLQNGADVVVAVKAHMRENASAPALVEAINRCERALRGRSRRCAGFSSSRTRRSEPHCRHFRRRPVRWRTVVGRQDGENVILPARPKAAVTGQSTR
jgi:hypothetical protein